VHKIDIHKGSLWALHNATVVNKAGESNLIRKIT